MLSLNSTILCSTFSFLDVKDLTYLDSAYTSSEWREKLLHIWKQDWLEVFNPLHLYLQSILWIKNKGLQPLNCQISKGYFSAFDVFPFPTCKVRNLYFKFPVDFLHFSNSDHLRTKCFSSYAEMHDFKNVHTINYSCKFESMEKAAEELMNAFPTCTALHLDVGRPYKQPEVFEDFYKFVCKRTEVTICSWKTCGFTVRLDLIKMKLSVESNEWEKQILPTGKVVLRRQIFVLGPISSDRFYGRTPIAPNLNLRPPVLQLLNTFKIKSLELSTKNGSRATASLVYFAESLFLPMELTELKDSSVVFSVD